MNQEQNRNGFAFMDFINIISLLIGIANMYENEAQFNSINITEKNQMQAEYLLGQIKSEFEKQNEILSMILDRLDAVK